MGNTLHRKHGEHYLVLNNEMIQRAKTTTHFNEQQIRNYHSTFFSVTKDGKLKKSSLNKLLDEYLPGDKKSRSKYLTDSIFNAIDQDENGYMDFFEYLYALKYLQSDVPIEKAEFMYRVLDRDGDKSVTRNELYKLLKCLESYHRAAVGVDSKEYANQVLEKLDEDKSGTITPSEFIDGYLKDETMRALFTL
ncbi:unnamed protein product [Didymodactylos carnosus]|uniref:EF-hand domain-containing protein n=1 Tax=Didymodactylos carnosus TaxID=1234261 RepID=A0A815GS06_9BILA|nr:unnamed protein product [Didymodactylos carnosus]CAF4204446.1 unnamed protein product [Didymodactylos carnosus]